MPGQDPRFTRKIKIKGNQTKAKPVRKNFGTIMSEMDPRDRKEMIKKGKLQKKPIKKMKRKA